MTYEQYAPGLRYGYDLANNDTYRNKRWSDIEPYARRDWEARNPGTAWDKIKAAVQHSWEAVDGPAVTRSMPGITANICGIMPLAQRTRAMNNMGNKTSESESGARKVGTYDIPDDVGQGSAAVAEPSRGLSWLWWLLALIVLIALLAWAFNFFNPGSGPRIRRRLRPPRSRPSSTCWPRRRAVCKAGRHKVRRGRSSTGASFRRTLCPYKSCIPHQKRTCSPCTFAVFLLRRYTILSGCALRRANSSIGQSASLTPRRLGVRVPFRPPSFPQRLCLELQRNLAQNPTRTCRDCKPSIESYPR